VLAAKNIVNQMCFSGMTVHVGVELQRVPAQVDSESAAIVRDCKNNGIFMFAYNNIVLLYYIVEYQCGKSTSENGTYFTSPATPQRICNLMINRVNDNICQVPIFSVSNFK
jgi:hypothetical protein